MEIRNGNKDKSESSSLSSKKAMQEESKEEEEPCEICGSVGIAGLMMICFKCRHTREHTYCARVVLSPVRDIWLCEACRLPSRVLFISHEDLMDSETAVAGPKNTSNSRVDDRGTAKLRANDMEEVVDTHEASTRVMHLPTQPQPHTRPLAKETLSSQNKEQHQPTQSFPKKRRTIRVMGKHLSQSHGGTLISPLDQSLTGVRASPK
ncbi:uncharacterized protein LOC106444279 [Brassica napus]|nr:uncharacterized protein LOC106444279 [Brassica napus]